MVREVTDDDWKYIQKKFKKLIHYASWRTPQFGYLSIEDKEGEINEVVLKAIEKYTPEEGASDAVSDFIQTSHFAAYVKACIWYRRSHITKRTYKIRPVDGDNVSLSALAPAFVESVDFFVEPDSPLRDIELPEDLKRFAVAVMSDHRNFRNKSGKINVSKVSRELNIPVSRTKKMIERLTDAISVQM